MKIATVAYGFLFVFVVMVPALNAQDDRPVVSDQERRGNDSPAGVTDDPVKDTYHDSWIDGFIQDEHVEQSDAGVLDGLSSLHLPGASYALVPAPSWYSNQYSGFAVDAFRVADRMWLINSIHYAYYNTTRDENFPDRLQKLGDTIVLRGDWFTAGVAVSSKSNILFQSFKSVNINAGADFRVWRTGPHSIRVGFLSSSRAEFWGSAFPLPTFAYRYMTRRFLMSVGVPLYMVWRPGDDICVLITGMLPGVGSARIRFKLHLYVSLSLSWTHQVEPFYPTSYPFRDIRYLKYRVQKFFNYKDEIEENKKFMLSTNRAGVTLSFNIEGYASVSIFNGIQFWSSYYRTKNIMDLRPDREWIANAYIFEVSARGFLYSMGNSK
jgi:hypothetical protein